MRVPPRTKRSHGRAFTYERPPSLVFVSNHLPTPPDRASTERLIVGEMRVPTEVDERLVEALRAAGPERDRIGSACLSWLIRGCAEYLEHGLGPVALCAHKPAGLELWWADALEGGRITLGGWSALSAVRADLTGHDCASVGDHDLAAFLRTKVEAKRFNNDGRRYGLTIRDA